MSTLSDVVTVDELKEALGLLTDIDLASRLGVERSTIAQWRRRQKVPQHWHFVLANEGIEDRLLATRRQVFGDGHGHYVMMAALAILDVEDLDWADWLMPMAVGHSRLERILLACSYVIDALAGAQCSSQSDYESLVARLMTPEHKDGLKMRLAKEG
jgi:hypothetical protein